MKPDSLITKRFNELAEIASSLRVGASGMDHAAFQEWAVSALGLIGRVFGEDGPHFKSFNEGWGYYNTKGGSHTSLLLATFKAAKNDYGGGHLGRVRSLVVAEVGDDVLEQAEALHKSGYKDPACILARVSLEIALRDLCDRQGLDHGKLDRMNADLAKLEAYNKSMQKQITAWAGRGNDAAHGDWDQYTSDDVKDMIAGVRRFIADYL